MGADESGFSTPVFDFASASEMMIFKFDREQSEAYSLAMLRATSKLIGSVEPKNELTWLCFTMM